MDSGDCKHVPTELQGLQQFLRHQWYGVRSNSHTNSVLTLLPNDVLVGLKVSMSEGANALDFTSHAARDIQVLLDIQSLPGRSIVCTLCSGCTLVKRQKPRRHLKANCRGRIIHVVPMASTPLPPSPYRSSVYRPYLLYM